MRRIFLDAEHARPLEARVVVGRPDPVRVEAVVAVEHDEDDGELRGVGELVDVRPLDEVPLVPAEAVQHVHRRVAPVLVGGRVVAGRQPGDPVLVDTERVGVEGPVDDRAVRVVGERSVGEQQTEQERAHVPEE